VAPATDLSDVLPELDAGDFDGRLHRVGLLVIDGERDEAVLGEGDDEREQRTDSDGSQLPIDRRPASHISHDVGQLVIRQIEELDGRHL
jgi:hypothetical protein